MSAFAFVLVPCIDFFFAWCASTHFMQIIAALVCAITALPTSLLKPSAIPLEVIPSAGCSNINMKDIWKAVTKQSDALTSFANCWQHMVTKCKVFKWVQQSSNILIGTFIFFTLCKFKGEWNYVNPILLHSVSSAFQLFPTGVFFFFSCADVHWNILSGLFSISLDVLLVWAAWEDNFNHSLLLVSSFEIWHPLPILIYILSATGIWRDPFDLCCLPKFVGLRALC